MRESMRFQGIRRMAVVGIPVGIGRDSNMRESTYLEVVGDGTV
jgi:hypothetical protein